MLVTSIFSFSYNVFYPIKKDSAIWAIFNPLPDDKISDWSKLKQTANDILKCI